MAAETEAAAPAPGEPMDVNSAVKLVLKKALAHDGLCRGLRETTRAIEKDSAQLCILAEDCDQPDYKKLVEALCAEKQVHLLSVPEAKQLGQWAGVSQYVKTLHPSIRTPLLRLRQCQLWSCAAALQDRPGG